MASGDRFGLQRWVSVAVLAERGTPGPHRAYGDHDLGRETGSLLDRKPLVDALKTKSGSGAWPGKGCCATDGVCTRRHSRRGSPWPYHEYRTERMPDDNDSLVGPAHGTTRVAALRSHKRSLLVALAEPAGPCHGGGSAVLLRLRAGPVVCPGC